MDFLTNPFATALLLLYQLLGQNIVLAIVVFTVLVRLLTLPLTIQQQRSTQAMQAVQPQLKKLQEKHKGEREKLAAAQMALYKEHGVNPAAGCLPLVIQFPILIGLYGAIMQALAATPLQLLDLHDRLVVPSLASLVPLENRFLLWNLAQPDPIYVLPILVVVTTWLQQKLIMPSTPADPGNQAAAMTRNMTVMMPLIFGFISISMASGLSIYFIVSNLIGVAQYALMGKTDFRQLFNFGPGRAAQADAAPKPAKSGQTETTRRAAKAKAKAKAK